MSDRTRERRAHKRFDLACPVTISDSAGRELFTARTANISDGGALLVAPAPPPIPLGAMVHAAVRVPRTTANTYMLEDFFSSASVIRRETRADGPPGFAVQFTRPLRLELDA